MRSKLDYLAIFAVFATIFVCSFAVRSDDNISIVEVDRYYSTMVTKYGVDIISNACMTYEEIYKKYNPIEISSSEDGYRLFLDREEFFRGEGCWIHIIKQSSYMGSSN